MSTLSHVASLRLPYVISCLTPQQRQSKII